MWQTLKTVPTPRQPPGRRAPRPRPKVFLVLFLQKKNKNLLFLKKKKQKDFYFFKQLNDTRWLALTAARP
jgi:hypothetical protein